MKRDQQNFDRILNKHKGLISMLYREINEAIDKDKNEICLRLRLTAIEFEELNFFFEVQDIYINVEEGGLLKIIW